MRGTEHLVTDTPAAPTRGCAGLAAVLHEVPAFRVSLPEGLDRLPAALDELHCATA